MIDYKKIKQAHESCFDTNYVFTLEFGWEDAIEIKLYKHLNGLPQYICDFSLIDDLITKIRELTGQKTQYKIGQEVWLMQDGRIVSDEISEIDHESDEKYYLDDDRWYMEHELYPTKEALIDAQVNYWIKMRGPMLEPGECQHEPEWDVFACKWILAKMAGQDLKKATILCAKNAENSIDDYLGG